MRGGALPPSLLFAALGLALSFAPRRAIAPAAVLAVLTAIAVSYIRVATDWEDVIFLGCWVGVAIAAASVHLPGGISPALALVLALNNGLWAGAVIAAAAPKHDLLIAPLAILIVVPGAWLTATGRGIAVKVASSWLIAIGILSLCLQLAPTTPGYKPDHMD